jgi:cell division protease FtsH
VDESYTRAITILREHEDVLHRLSLCLIEKENLSGVEVDEIIADDGPICNGKKAATAAATATEITEEAPKPVDIQA